MRRYRNIFAYAAYQFCGHIPEYLIANTERLCLFYFETRFGEKNHLVRYYESGKLVREQEYRSSHNLFLYYFLLFWWGNVVLWRFASNAKDRVVAFCGHPVNLFGMSFHRLFHGTLFSYWIGDYFPVQSFVIRAFEQLKQFYHNRVDFAWYLSDAINRIENGRVVDADKRKTVAWGIRLYPNCEKCVSDARQILFVGLLRKGQGLEKILEFIASESAYRLAIIGEAANGYDAVLRDFIAKYHLEERVFFPNRFYSQEELLEEARKSFVGVALYDLDKDNFTHYADPGKVKAYLEMGLPVVMTRISDVVRHLEGFHAGIVVDSIDQLGAAFTQMQAQYPAYKAGALEFVRHYDYESYYAKSFRAVEEVWK